MWYRYSDTLRKAVLRSLTLSEQEGLTAFSTRHLLIGLSYFGEAADILQRLDVAEQLRHDPPSILESLPASNNGIQLTPSTRTIMAGAYQEAAKLGDSYVGTEHVLLTMLRHPDCEAGAILAARNITLQMVSHELLMMHSWRTIVPEGTANRAEYRLEWRKITQWFKQKTQFLKRIALALTQIGSDPVVYSFLFTQQRLTYPHKFFHRLRKRGLYFSRAAGGWVISGYDDVQNVLRAPQLSARRFDWSLLSGNPALPPLIEREFNTLWGGLTRQMLFLDAPEQTRARSLVSRQFTPRVLSQVRTQIQEIADELLDAMEAREEMDIIADFSFPLPATVIARLLGVNDGDLSDFKSWSDAFVRFISAYTTLSEDLKAYESMRLLTEYFHNIVTTVRQNPNETTLLSLLANAVDDEGNRLTDDEVTMNAMLLLAAGHETTTHLIANGLLLLLNNPESLADLKADPTLMPGAVEEMLRHAGPVQWTSRIALENLNFNGQEIKRGQSLNIALAAANRDPSRFPDPDAFDIRRKDNRHISFGSGPHFCLGAALARMETEIALNTLLRRFPKIRLAQDKADWRHDFTFRAQKTMRVLLK